MKCCDLPDLDVLTAIAATARPLGATFTEVAEALHPFPVKLVRAKLSKLLRRGLISGCCCGCRGDFFVVAVEQALDRMDGSDGTGLTERSIAKAVARIGDTIDNNLLDWFDEQLKLGEDGALGAAADGTPSTRPHTTAEVSTAADRLPERRADLRSPLAQGEQEPHDPPPHPRARRQGVGGCLSS